MDKKTFKGVLKKCVISLGFTRYRTWYVLDCKDLYITIKDIRSNFSELYHIEYGIYVKSRWNDNSYKEKEPLWAEIRGELVHCDLEEKIDENTYEKQLKEDLQNKIVPLIKYGEPYLREKVWNSKSGEFFLFMSNEEKKEWSLNWKNRLS